MIMVGLFTTEFGSLTYSDTNLCIWTALCKDTTIHSLHFLSLAVLYLFKDWVEHSGSKIFGGVPLVCPQGNKRTPERFVGREAVITTQCLNGWYLSLPLPLHPSFLMQLWKKLFLPQVEDQGWVEESWLLFPRLAFTWVCLRRF
jgi:hypothetical protein